MYCSSFLFHPHHHRRHQHFRHVLLLLLLSLSLARCFFIVRRVCIDPRLLGAIRFVSPNEDESSHSGEDSDHDGGHGGRGSHHHRHHGGSGQNHGEDGENHRTGLTHKQGNITRLDSWPGHGSKGSNTEATTEAGDDIEKFLVGRRRRRRRRRRRARRAALWAHPALYDNPAIGEQLSFTSIHQSGDSGPGPGMDDVPDFNPDSRQRRKFMRKFSPLSNGDFNDDILSSSSMDDQRTSSTSSNNRLSIGPSFRTGNSNSNSKGSSRFRKISPG